MRRFEITENDAGQRADKFVSKVAPHLPKSLLYKSFRNRKVKRNGKRCDIFTILAKGDVLELYINDEFFGEADFSFTHASKDITIIYEDENVLLIDKPSGLLIHGSTSKKENTLLDQALHYLYHSKSYLPKQEHSFTPAFVNRLDRNTQGIVVLAKNFPSLQILSEKMKAREVGRYYLCQVVGVPTLKTATLLGYHIKDGASNQVTITEEWTATAKQVETKYTVLQSGGDTSWLEVSLITGRSHQIRAHLASIGHPLVGDKKYGYRGPAMGGQRLYSYRVSFDFTTDAGQLNYLKGKRFTLDAIPEFR